MIPDMSNTLRKPSKQLLKNIAGKVKAYRLSKNLSQEKFAEVCEFHRTYIGAIERCEINLSLSSLEVIAEAIGIQVHELLSLTEIAFQMNTPVNPTHIDYVSNIRNSNKTIHDPITIDDPNLWIPDEILEKLLNDQLNGFDVSAYTVKSRSKIVKQKVCEILGYPVEQTFPKVQPRFTGQNFDTYNQKSRNLQIWNEEVSAERRYVIIGIDENNIIYKVKVINGEELAKLDTTGKITTKYQARFVPNQTLELVSKTDTSLLIPYLSDDDFQPNKSPISFPLSKELLSIEEIFTRLSPLIGQTFNDPGIVQERNRGAGLHRLVCKALGYSNYADDGKFPDIKNQLLEVKLQTSPTVDLGLVCPNSLENIGLFIDTTILRHCDTRYAVFYATTNGTLVTLTNLVITTGENFFNRFQQFQGKVVNGKIQLPLPSNFFN